MSKLRAYLKAFGYVPLSHFKNAHNWSMTLLIGWGGWGIFLVRRIGKKGE